MNAHGISVIEIAKNGSTVTYKTDSAFNRRITTFTEMTLSGPAAKTPYMITAYSPDGSKTRGTINNCGNGYTPWGTYLTTEENWAGYVRRITATDKPNRTAKELVSFALRQPLAGWGECAAPVSDSCDHQGGWRDDWGRVGVMDDVFPLR